MTAKQYVLNYDKSATVEKAAEKLHLGKWQVWTKWVYIAGGKTESSAWVNAKKKIIENGNKN